MCKDEEEKSVKDEGECKEMEEEEDVAPKVSFWLL